MFGYILLGIGFVIILGILVVVISQIGRNRRCPHCTRLVRTDAAVCPYCTRDIR